MQNIVSFQISSKISTDRAVGDKADGTLRPRNRSCRDKGVFVECGSVDDPASRMVRGPPRGPPDRINNAAKTSACTAGRALTACPKIVALWLSYSRLAVRVRAQALVQRRTDQGLDCATAAARSVELHPAIDRLTASNQRGLAGRQAPSARSRIGAQNVLGRCSVQSWDRTGPITVRPAADSLGRGGQRRRYSGRLSAAS